MLLTPHILTGAVIITKVQNPVLGLFLVFLSHYFLDLFPQKEYAINNVRGRRWLNSFLDFSKVLLDISLGMLLILFFSEVTTLIFAAAFLAILPDGFTLLTIIFNQNRLLKKHDKLHVAINAVCENEKISPFWGVFSQVLIILIAIFLLL